MAAATSYLPLFSLNEYQRVLLHPYTESEYTTMIKNI